jgi:hypothetical protein
MSGSRKWFVYTSDLGVDYAIQLDESNTEAVNAGTQDFPNNGTIQAALPRNIKARYLRFRSPDGATVRKCVALTAAIFGNIGPGSTIPNPNGAGDLILTAKVGEKITVPIGPDTGLNDGDIT